VRFRAKQLPARHSLIRHAPAEPGEPAQARAGHGRAGRSRAGRAAGLAGLGVILALAACSSSGSPSAKSSTSVTAGSNTAAGKEASCAAVSGSPGVSDSQIKLGVLLFAAAGGQQNQAYGIATLDEQKGQSGAIAGALNAAGGVACRKMVLQYFTAEVLDQAALQQVCKDVSDAGVFAVIDPGAYNVFPGLAECYPKARVPYFTTTAFAQKQLQGDYPYLFAGASLDSIYRNTVLGLARQGFFDKTKGFTKLGFLYASCNTDLVGYYKSLLTQAGLSSSDIVTYDLGCPSPATAPAVIQQAVLKFKSAGVTHVTEMQDYTDWVAFTTLAQQQNFHPLYGLPDESLIADGVSGPAHPDFANIKGTIAISPYSDGDQGPPAATPAAATTKCNQVITAAGQPGIYQRAAAGGLFCSAIWLFAAAADNAPRLDRASLAQGLATAKTVQLPYPAGPNNYTAKNTIYGGQYWRAITFNPTCNCFKPTTQFQPSL
jgi:hypothetical protein